jgi:hypothetical protein
MKYSQAARTSVCLSSIIGTRVSNAARRLGQPAPTPCPGFRGAL